MALTPSLPTGSPAGLQLLAERRIWAGAVARAADGTPRTGVLPAHFGPLVTGKASMGYNIAEFVAVTSRQSPGVEFVANDGTVDLSPAGYAAPTANSRLDVIWVRSRFTGFGDASDAAEFGITQGAASPTPVKPSLPAGAFELAIAEVKATDTTTQTVVITQTARYTAMAGGIVPVRNAVELAAWTPANGGRAFRTDLSVPYDRVGDAWVPTTSGAVSTTTDAKGFVTVTHNLGVAGYVPNVQISNGPLNGLPGPNTLLFTPYLWERSSTGFRVRYRREDTNDWVDNLQAVRFQWSVS